MTDVLLIFPGQRVSGMQALAHVRLPYSLVCLAGHLRSRHVKVEILDMRIEDMRACEIPKASIVGFSCMTGHQIRYALRAAEYLQQLLPEALFVWGGIHPSLHPEETAAHPMVDVVVVGEGEETLLDIVETFYAGRDLAGIPGTVIMQNGEPVAGGKRPFINLDDSPFPAYDLIDIRRYPNCIEMFDYQTSRGCPFRCGFCYNVQFCGRQWRGKSPEKTVEELARLQREYDVRSFSFVDDEFFINARRAEGIFDLIIQRRVRFNWTASCRLDLCRRFTPDFLAKMKTTGCTQMYFGGESGSEETLETITKDITPSDTIKGVENCINNGIIPIVSFMGGFPGETKQQFEETLDLITTLWGMDPLVTVNGIFPFSPYPGTALFDKARGYGLKTPSSLEEWGEWAFQYDPDHPWLTADERRRLRVSFYIVRFKYHLKEYNWRNKNRPVRRAFINFITLPLRISAAVRWKGRFFACAWEWELWALLARKTFGFL